MDGIVNAVGLERDGLRFREVKEARLSARQVGLQVEVSFGYSTIVMSPADAEHLATVLNREAAVARACMMGQP